MKMSIERLCRDVPKEFEAYMSYVKSLQFSDNPDYEFLKDIFHKLYEAEGFSYEAADFDWSKHGTLPSDVNRYVCKLKLEKLLYNHLILNFRYNRANRDSKVSSVNTEASVTEETSKYQEENGDILGLFM